MSNHLAVAMVTATLVRTLSDALAQARDGRVETAGVTTLRPPSLVAKTDSSTRGINVFLYHVVPNGIYAAEALPSRRSDGTLTARPRQGLDLHYLLTFTGDESTLEPQRLLGLAVGALADRPLLTRSVITTAVQEATEHNPAAWEGFADLADQMEPVRVGMVPMTIEEASRLWSSMFHSTYRLSVAYRAGVAVVEGLSKPVDRPDRPEGIDIAVAPGTARDR
ncbi:DUF4255 domain-containing protein [Cryptosporangium sp. NPDC051539]|uniref:DUF4255 domain-containing protein n=1 Tax=Cryptosporangium sp. NPDC051539 TaxID=3363962 RepID=UPI003787D51E